MLPGTKLKEKRFENCSFNYQVLSDLGEMDFRTFFFFRFYVILSPTDDTWLWKVKNARFQLVLPLELVGKENQNMKKINHSKKTGAVVGVCVLAAILIGVSVLGMEKKTRKQNAETAASGTNQEQTVLANQTESVKEAGPDSTVSKETKSEESGITSEQALAAALKDAGLGENEVTVFKNKKEYEDGREVYDLEFITEKLEYSYEILALDGTILKAEREKVDGDIQRKYQRGDSNGSSGSNDSAKSSDIGMEGAKNIALKHAGISGEVQYKKAKLEREDGRYVYEIEFYYNQMEYEYEILASDGRVLDWSAEMED
ncbi:Peptidase propeptide and YPEB domain [uncultured Roseburia sp.]|nr:Peptidase propeptide and YPEB domain [uncultured Roseburia sp.]